MRQSLNEGQCTGLRGAGCLALIASAGAYSRARGRRRYQLTLDEPGNTCACRHEETQGEAMTFIQFSSNMATGGCSVRVPRAGSSALKPAHEEW